MTNTQKTKLDELISFAAIGRPHGLKGGFFLKTEDRRKKWDGYKSVFLQHENQLIEKKVTKHYLSGQALVLELEGLQSREDIEKLYNQKLYIQKNQIQLKDDEYLVHDLLQYKIVCQNKGVLGEVVGMVSYGAQENLEIKLTENNKIILYPFVDQYILNINSDTKEIEVEYLEVFFLG
jgi:16S rRNA processing protein RimM